MREFSRSGSHVDFFVAILGSVGHLRLRVLLKSISTKRLSKTLAKQDWVWLSEIVRDNLLLLSQNRLVFLSLQILSKL